MTNTQTPTNIRLPPDLKEKVRRIATQLGESDATVIRQAIRHLPEPTPPKERHQ